jgi:hypothetical protein
MSGLHPPGPPVSVDHPLVQEPGLYFGMPEDEYHRAFALSATGIKHLRISPLDFWARSPLNAERAVEESEARRLGRAYHKRIIEGETAFQAMYAAELDPSEYPRALRTNEELKAAIERAGGPGGRLGSMRKAELIDRLLQYDPEALVWDRLVAAHYDRHAGKIRLPARAIRRIEIAAAMIEKHPQLQKAFSGGMPEVSVFWLDGNTGVPCKARFDYLKPRAIVDLKSYENTIGLPVRKAIARCVANYRYHIQAAFYLEGAKAARELVAEGRAFGAVDPGFLRPLVDAPERHFLFVFQQKGPAPLARGMVLAPGLTLDIGREEIAEAMHLFAHCWRIYSADPWLDPSEIETFDPTEFPAYIAE